MWLVFISHVRKSEVEQKVGKEREKLKRERIQTSFLKKIHVEFSWIRTLLKKKSEDDECQPTVLKDGKENGELYPTQSFLENIVQTSVTIYAEKDVGDFWAGSTRQAACRHRREW